MSKKHLPGTLHIIVRERGSSMAKDKKARRNRNKIFLRTNRYFEALFRFVSTVATGWFSLCELPHIPLMDKFDPF